MGFTLIELMLVVAIIGLLAAIALPKFANLVVKSKEAAVKGALGGLRSAISIYYADNEGRYPYDYSTLPASLTAGGKYLNAIPRISIPTQPDHAPPLNYIHYFFPTYDWPGLPMAWTYQDGNQAMPVTHELRVACTHTDTKGIVWSSY